MNRVRSVRPPIQADAMNRVRSVRPPIQADAMNRVPTIIQFFPQIDIDPQQRTALMLTNITTVILPATIGETLFTHYKIVDAKLSAALE